MNVFSEEDYDAFCFHDDAGVNAFFALCDDIRDNPAPVGFFDSSACCETDGWVESAYIDVECGD